MGVRRLNLPKRNALVQVRLTESIKTRLDAVAVQLNITRSAVVRRAVAAYLRELEGNAPKTDLSSRGGQDARQRP